MFRDIEREKREGLWGNELNPERKIRKKQRLKTTILEGKDTKKYEQDAVQDEK